MRAGSGALHSRSGICEKAGVCQGATAPAAGPLPRSGECLERRVPVARIASSQQAMGVAFVFFANGFMFSNWVVRIPR